ncbi:MAG: hypothetical protein AAF465_10660 [Pseudomonadota bacterium]
MSASPAARRAKRMLHKRLAPFGWYAGLGLVPAEGGLGLRVTASTQPNPDDVPTTYYGFPVEVVVTRGYVAR